MKHDEDFDEGLPVTQRNEADASTEVRIFAAWMGLVLVAMGVAMAGYLFFRIGQVLLDPRGFETQVDRWEFVVRGRTTHAFPDAFETPERRIQPTPAPADDGEMSTSRAASAPASDPVDDTVRLMGQLGSKSARAAALLLLVLVLMILVKIIVSVIHAGIRLAGLAGGEREYMKRIIDELAYQRRRGGD